MLKVLCKVCNTEVTSSSHGNSCGCSNMTVVKDDVISAKDLSMVEIITDVLKKKSYSEYKYLTQEDLAWMEQRKARKVRKLDFEIR